ncbi:MAG: HAMP domain-containing protein [Zoogloea sp.]|nr:HAMP domain-containing protein [Zoogloea sp.]
MELTHVLMRRAAWVSLGCFAFALALAGWRAGFDVRREGQGAAQTASLIGRLAELQSLPAEKIPLQIRALQDVSASGGLRHLQFRLEDEKGNLLVGPPSAGASTAGGMLAQLSAPGVQPAPAGESSWQILREDGRHFRATLIADPQSEQSEAFANILGLGAVLMLQSVTLLAAMYLTVRYLFAPLRNILGAIAAFERQDYSVRLPVMRIRELDVIGRSLNHLAQALARVQEERRSLSLKVLTLQEDERARISRELHDEFGQSLTAMRADAAYLARRCTERPELCEVARGIEEQCGGVQRGVRDLLRSLRGPGDGVEMAAVPLQELLRTLVESWQTRPGQLARYRLALDIPDSPLAAPLALGLYRMTQEALTNVARHAAAGEVVVALKGAPGEGICWSVCDDGAGIASLEQALQQGNGLAGMRERAWALGGELEMLAHPDKGVAGLCLLARLPWPTERQAEVA